MSGRVCRRPIWESDFVPNEPLCQQFKQYSLLFKTPQGTTSPFEKLLLHHRDKHQWGQWAIPTQSSWTFATVCHSSKDITARYAAELVAKWWAWQTEFVCLREILRLFALLLLTRYRHRRSGTVRYHYRGGGVQWARKATTLSQSWRTAEWVCCAGCCHPIQRESQRGPHAVGWLVSVQGSLLVRNTFVVDYRSCVSVCEWVHVSRLLASRTRTRHRIRVSLRHGMVWLYNDGQKSQR